MLSMRGISVSFGELQALRGIDLDVERGEIICLLGPSGCGKSTLLRVIAGLQAADTGDVQLEGKSIKRLPVHERGFGLMFQDFALFPHMSVFENVEFGLRMRGMRQPERRERVLEVLNFMGLDGFERRDVAQLSGGERQRVALARSLAPNPRLLMLDEPLGSLDAALKERLIIELREIIKRVGLTAVYVTHDQQEAYAIADRMAVMNAGIIEQVDTPQTLYNQPQTAFVAQFLGLNNVLPVLSQVNDIVRTAVGDFRVSGSPQAILLHPDGLSLDIGGPIDGQVVECVFGGDSYRVKMKHESGIVLNFKHHALLGVGELISVTANAVVGISR